MLLSIGVGFEGQCFLAAMTAWSMLLTFDRISQLARFVAGERQFCCDATSHSNGLYLCLLGHLQGIIDLDAEVSDGTFQLSMSKQQLYGSKILCPAINQCCFGAPQ